MSNSPTATANLVDDASFGDLQGYIVAATGLAFYADRAQALAAHIAERLQATATVGCPEYLALLQNGRVGDAEMDRLIQLITIGETYFFRHRELFDALRDVALPDLIQRNSETRRLRIWTAGCSIGAEAYSLSILLRRDLGHLLRGWNISILGTDVNREFLARAAAGSFEEWSFRGTPLQFREDCFSPCGDAWQIDPQFREGVSFAYHNLVRHPFPSLVHNLSAFDLILCRNVLIYFGADVVDRVISQLAKCLVEGGWLGVGHAEQCDQLRAHFQVRSFPGALLNYKAPHILACDGEAAPPMKSTSIRAPIAAAAAGKAAQPRPGGTRAAPRPPAAPAPQRADFRNDKTNEDDAVDGLARVKALADEGSIAAALELCGALIAKGRLDPQHYFYEALLRNQIGAYDDACQSLQRAIYLDRRFVMAHYHLGLTQLRRANRPEALRAFRNVRQLLARHSESDLLPEAGGLTVADLKELTTMHDRVLEDA